jgi:hypothetical protein
MWYISENGNAFNLDGIQSVYMRTPSNDASTKLIYVEFTNNTEVTTRNIEMVAGSEYPNMFIRWLVRNIMRKETMLYWADYLKYIEYMKEEQTDGQLSLFPAET